MTIEAKWSEWSKWSDLSRLDRDRALATANRLLPGWIALLLAILIAWQLARIVWMLVPASPLGDPLDARPVAAARASTSAGDGRPNVNAIAGAHLFGDTGKAPPVPQPVEQENVAETRLDLALKGTVAANKDDVALAIIAIAGKDEKVYAIGDTVMPGTTLQAVYPDRVILNRDGQLEALKLPKEFPGGASPLRRQAAPLVSRAPDANPSIREVVSENVTKLAEVIRPTPYFVSGQQQGYRVYPGRNRRQFAALGLRPGDLIKTVNGASLTDPQQAMAIFQSLGSSDQVTVTVERNGEPEVLVLNTSQLNMDNSQ